MYNIKKYFPFLSVIFIAFSTAIYATDSVCPKGPLERDPTDPAYKPIKILIKAPKVEPAPQIISPFCLYDHTTGEPANYPPNDHDSGEPSHPCISSHDYFNSRIWVLENDIIDIPSNAFNGNESYEKNKKDTYASFRVGNDGNLIRVYGGDYGTGDVSANIAHAEVSPHLLYAKATYLKKVDKPGEGFYNCAYYRIDVDPAAFPYDPRKNNGLFFALSARVPHNEDIKCDDPLYKNKSLSTHLFYPTNGVLLTENASNWFVTPLKQSVVLELPYDSSQDSFSPIDISLDEAVSGMHYAANDHPHWIPKASTRFNSQEAIKPDTFDKCLASITRGKSGLLKYDIVFDTAKPYIANRTFAIPVSIGLKDKENNIIRTHGDVCSFLYDHIAFFIDKGVNNRYPITNNIFSHDVPISYLPSEYATMKDQGFGNFPKYDSETGSLLLNDSQQSEKKDFYFYVGREYGKRSGEKYEITSMILMDEYPIEYNKVTSLSSTDTGSDKDEIKWDPIGDAYSRNLDEQGAAGREFSFTVKKYPISNPNMQRLDYVAGLEDRGNNKLLPGIFYSIFGGIMSNCIDAKSSDGTIYSVMGKDFNIVCNNPIVGKIGYSSPFLSHGEGKNPADRIKGKYNNGLLTNPSQRSTEKFIINDSHEISDTAPYRLVLFNTAGIPYIYREEHTDTRRYIKVDKQTCYISRLYIDNKRDTPLILWMKDQNRNVTFDTNLGNFNSPFGKYENKDTVKPSSGNEYTYMDPGTQIIVGSYNTVNKDSWYEVYGSYNFDMSNPFSFKVDKPIFGSRNQNQEFDKKPTQCKFSYYKDNIYGPRGIERKYYFNCYFIDNYIPLSQNVMDLSLKAGVNTNLNANDCSDKSSWNYQQLIITDSGAPFSFMPFYGDGTSPHTPYRTLDQKNKYQ